MGDDDNQEERGVLVILTFIHMQMIMITKIVESPVGGGGGTVGISGGDVPLDPGTLNLYQS